MHLINGTSAIGLPLVSPSEMVLNNYYVLDVTTFDDDSGEETIASEVVWFYEDNVPGQVKKQKLIRFTKEMKTLTFSRLPGAQFYGPFMIEMPEVRETPKAKVLASTAIDQILKELNK